MNHTGNKTFRYMGIALCIIVVFAAISSYFYWKSDNAVGPNLITAFVGVALSAVITLVLLNGQTKDEEEKERKLELYNAKLKVYSNFVSSMYKALSDGQITEKELLALRTKIFGNISFYAKEDVLISIENELKDIQNYTNIDKMLAAFVGITIILQNDLQNDLREERHDTKENVKNIWGRFEEIISNTNNGNEDPEQPSISPTTISDNPKDIVPHEEKRLEQQSWHFIMLDDRQIKKLKEGLMELSLIEYEGVNWRTNLVKQVAENDVIMLFRRGGCGYVGAFKAIGWRVFYFEEGREEIQMFGQEKQVIAGEQYLSDIKAYDIYESGADGATTCANIIVEPIAFVPEGVGNPGGVYRRTISRYDSHYAWLLKEEFKKVGQWIEP